MEQDLLIEKKKYFLGKESLKALDQAFAKEQLPCVLIKGFSLSEKYWKDPLQRPIGDIDLCFSPENFEQASKVLHNMGAEEEKSSRWEGNQFKKVFYFRGMPVELHQHLLYGERSVEVENWRPSTIEGCEWIQELSPEHNLIYLAGHAGHQHFYEQWFWLEDIYFLLKMEKLDHKKVLTLAKEMRLEKVLYLSLKLIEKKYHTSSLTASFFPHNRFTTIDFLVWPLAKRSKMASKHGVKQWSRFWLRDSLKESFKYLWLKSKLKLPFKF